MTAECPGFLTYQLMQSLFRKFDLKYQKYYLIIVIEMMSHLMRFNR